MPGFTPRHLARRHVLRFGLGAAATLLAACGAGAPATTVPAATTAPAATTPSAATTASQAATSAPQPAATAVKPVAGAATPAASGAQAPAVRLGFQPPYIAVFAMQNQKLLEAAFKDTPTTVEYRRLLSLNPIVEGVAGGALDLGMGGPPVGALASGQPIRILALIEKSPKTHAILVRPDSPVKAVADLKGKKLGNPIGKAYAFPQRVLDRAGIKESEVQWVTLENNEGRSALVTGAIDAWVTWDPFYASAEAAKQVAVLVDGEGYHTNYVTLFGRADFVERYPETVKRFLQTYKQALTWVQANRAEAAKIFAEENKIEPAVAELTLNRRNYLIIPPNDEFVADVGDQGKLFARLGVIEKEPDWKTVIVSDIAKAALGG